MSGMDQYPDLKTYREAKGLTQAQMADLISASGKRCGQGRVSQWESGQLGDTPEWATQIELATNGELDRVRLIFGPAPTPDAGEAAA